MCDAMNSAVSSAAAPFSMINSLKQPLSVPSATRAVVADDVVDERVLEDVEVVEGVDQPADVVVGVLEEARVDLHLAREHRLQLVRHVVPCGDLVVPGRQLGVGGITPSAFCRANVSSRSASHPWSNLPLYFADQSAGT